MENTNDTSTSITRTDSSRAVPTPTAHFLGSFAVDARQEKRRQLVKRNAITQYLTEEWDDTSIWRSAVSENL
jgi:hypothetical protein